MDYNIHPVAAPLAPMVECLWTLEGDAAELGGEVQSILPDGRPEIVLHFGDRFNRLADDDRLIERQAEILFAGQLPGELRLQPTGRISLLGVRLRPDAAAALLAPPQDELTGLTLALDLIARPLARSLADVRDAAAGPREALAAVQQTLTEHVDATRLDPAVRAAIDAIERTAGAISIEDVARQSGMSRRQLERRFKALVGLPPKRLARIARLQRALRLLDSLEARDRGARTAAECGYADQAHFVRDCRELFGIAPAASLEQRALLTGFFLAPPA